MSNVGDIATKQSKIPHLEKPAIKIKDIKKSHKGIPLQELIDLRLKGLTITQIAVLKKCSYVNVYNRLSEWYDQIDGLEHFKKNRGDMFALIQSKVIDSLNHADIKSISADRRMNILGIAYDKERLERGQSTQNVAYNDLTDQYKSLKEQLAKIEVIDNKE